MTRNVGGNITSYNGGARPWGVRIKPRCSLSSIQNLIIFRFPHLLRHKNNCVSIVSFRVRSLITTVLEEGSHIQSGNQCGLLSSSGPFLLRWQWQPQLRRTHTKTGLSVRLRDEFVTLHQAELFPDRGVEGAEDEE
jgi:hypothetical protein